MNARYDFDDLLEPVKGSGWCYVEPCDLPHLDAWHQRFMETYPVRTVVSDSLQDRTLGLFMLEPERPMPFVGLIFGGKKQVHYVYLSASCLHQMERVMRALHNSLTPLDHVLAWLGRGFVYNPAQMVRRLNAIQ